MRRKAKGGLFSGSGRFTFEWRVTRRETLQLLRTPLGANFRIADQLLGAAWFTDMPESQCWIGSTIGPGGSEFMVGGEEVTCPSSSFTWTEIG